MRPSEDAGRLRVLLYCANLRLAEAMRESLSDIADVTSTDSERYPTEPADGFDLFVGMGPRFETIATALPPTIRTVYMATEMHPLEREDVLRTFAGGESLQDETHEATLAGATADFIVCFGNTLTANSYLQHGTAPERIKLLSHVSSSAPGSPRACARPRRYLYLASDPVWSGDRIVSTLLSGPSAADLYDLHLDIIRSDGNSDDDDSLAELRLIVGDRMAVHEADELSPEEYSELLARVDFLICPALDERHAATIADATAHGVIPILSPFAGIDFSPLGLLELESESEHNEEILLTSHRLQDEELDRFKRHAVEYHRQFHADARSVLAETLRAAAAGQLYPRVSLVLPIFNKESTIEELLEDLNRSVERYPDVELHIFFDGCHDRTEEVVRSYFARRKPAYDVTLEVTPDIFEVKTNNLGLRKSTGKYCVILQDDVYVDDPLFLFEVVNFLDRNPSAAVLGGLGGVNIYPRGTRGLRGPGQVAMLKEEVSWRQDGQTDPSLKHRFFEVDACMRGPLILRKSFLEEHGYLDEIYAPLHQDDMDICFRAHHVGQRVYAALMEVENRSLTVAQYNDPAKSKRWQKIVNRNLDVFYKRWSPSFEKDYGWIHRFPTWRPGSVTTVPAWRPSLERPTLTRTPLAKLRAMLARGE